MSEESNIKPKSKLRWFLPTPDKLLVMLLAVEGVLLLSERWIPKGWAVVIAIAAVSLFLLMMLLWLVVALLFRCRFQFSIQSLLVLTVTVAVPCSWMSVEMKWAREQKEAVEALLKLHVLVGYDSIFNSSSSMLFRATPSGPQWLRKLLGDDFFGNVTFVFFHKAEVTNDDLVHIEGISTIQYLTLGDNPITDSGLEHIDSLSQLQMLDLSFTHVTDSGMKHLERLKTLQMLYLSKTQATDAGITKLQKALPNCKIYH